ncbi:MAG: hypothetical protein GY754_07735 [bacterium]|nr:hypothetical protein [bacterium]
MEASLTEWRKGYGDNARAGMILARHKPGKKESNPATGEGPAPCLENGQTFILPGTWLLLPGSILLI